MRRYDRMTWPEAEAAATRPAVLPLGACEQHGPHLPLTVDTVLAEGMAEALAEAIGGVLLPPVTYGEAWSCEAFPGTLSLSPAVLRAVIEDLARGVRRIGHPALILLNGHFGNRAPALEAAAALGAEGYPVLVLDYPRLEELAAAICDSEPAGPGFYHADEVETSMMLALAPEKVRMPEAAPEYPVFPADFGSRPMQLREFNASGVFGDPRPASAEKGLALIEGIVENCRAEVAAFFADRGLEEDAWQP